MMSRTYKVRRIDDDFQGVRKEWVLVNKRGAKKFQRMVNKRCRRLDKIAIAEGLNEIIDDRRECIDIFAEHYEEDLEAWDWVEEDPFFEDPEDWDEGKIEYDYEDYPDPSDLEDPWLDPFFLDWY